MQKGFIYRFVVGIIIGAANIVPCVSGGTMMVICGVFDDIMHSIGHFFSQMRKSILYLLPMAVGAGLGILLLANTMKYMLENYYMITNFLFAGIIIGSFPMILKHCLVNKFRAVYLIPMLITFAIMLATAFVLPESNNQIIRELDVAVFFKLFLSAAFSAVCMIIPGISGSFVMLLLGVYTTVTTAIAEFNILLLVPIGLGIMFGVIFGSRLIDNLIKKFPSETYFAILGFMLGSIPTIFIAIGDQAAYRFNWELAVALVAMVLGYFISYGFSGRSDKNINKA